MELESGLEGPLIEDGQERSSPSSNAGHNPFVCRILGHVLAIPLLLAASIIDVFLIGVLGITCYRGLGRHCNCCCTGCSSEISVVNKSPFIYCMGCMTCGIVFFMYDFLDIFNLVFLGVCGRWHELLQSAGRKNYPTIPLVLFCLPVWPTQSEKIQAFANARLENYVKWLVVETGETDSRAKDRLNPSGKEDAG